MQDLSTSSPTAATKNYTKSGQLGFSLFEMAVVVTLLAILMGVLFQRLHYLQEIAEKTAMEITVMNMRTGLRYKITALIIAGRMQDLPQLLDENPINWLENPPTNYQGEFTSLVGSDIFPGDWYFDVRAKQLVYQLNLDDHFLSKQNGVSEIRFKTMGLTQSSNAEINAFESITLNAISTGQWFETLVL